MKNKLLGIFNNLEKEKKRLISLSIIRMTFGLILFTYFTSSFGYREIFFGENGLGANLNSGEHLFFYKDYFITCVYIGMILFSILFIIGFKTKIANIILLIGFTFIGYREPSLFNSGDVMLRLMLFYMMFTHSSEYFSIDKLLNKKTKKKQNELGNVIHNLGVTAIIIQLMIIYFFGAITKNGWMWTEGYAMYYLSYSEMLFINDGLKDLLNNYPFISKIIVYPTLLFQFLFPFVIWFERSKYLVLSLAIIFHLSIIFTTGIFYFSIIMIAVDLILIRDKEYIKFKNKMIKEG